MTSTAAPVRAPDSTRTEPAPERPAAARTRWWLTAGPPVAALVGLSTAFMARASFDAPGGRTFTLFDDAMVSMRFARNLAEGHGLVYNAGQAPVEGYTNFLWTLWMAALHLVPVPVRMVPLLVSLSGVGLLVLGVLLVGKVARGLAPDAPAVAAVAMWTTALYYPLIFWALRGLEPGLLAVLVQASVLVAWRLRDAPTPTLVVGLTALLVAGVLTRTDFVLLAGVVVIWLAAPGASRTARRAAAIAGGAVVVAIALHTLFRIAYYGDALPNTFTLKLGGVGLATRLARGGAGLGAVVLAELALALALAAVAVASPRLPRHRAVLLIGLFGMAAAYSVFVGGDAWEYLQYANRYLAPTVPVLLVLAACGCREIVDWPVARARLALLGLAAVALIATVGGTALGRDDENLRNSFNLDRLARDHWIALAGGLALLLVCLLLVGRGRLGLAVAAIAGALVVLVVLPAWAEWSFDAGHMVRENEYETRLGLGLRQIAHGEPSVAVVAAGTIPYWSTLPAVDLLGKSDPVIAAEPNRRRAFLPGHTKWDYRFSICGLRPTLVVQLYEPTDADRARIEGCGYRHVVNDVYLRADQSAFGRQALGNVVFGTKH